MIRDSDSGSPGRHLCEAKGQLRNIPAFRPKRSYGIGLSSVRLSNLYCSPCEAIRSKGIQEPRRNAKSEAEAKQALRTSLYIQSTSNR
jgi:hypothetical protein